MARASLKALAALAAASLAACSSDVPMQPDVAGPGLSPARADAAPSADPVVAGEVIVKLKDGASVDALARTHGVGKGRAGYANAFNVVLTTAGNERAMAARLAADPSVEYAEPNYLRQVDADSRLWAFFNPGGLNMQYTSGGTGYIPASYASVADADEDALAGIGSGGAPVVIGSIDTGVEFNHPEFTGTMAGANVGVAGATGAAANVKVYVQRVCGANGCPTTAIVNAIRAAADYPGLVAMNLSLGGRSESSSEVSAIQYATDKGVLVIASAGNSGSGKVACPACDPNAISVSSTTWQDQLAAYSQYGSGLDISAPGGYCYSNTTPEGCIYSSVSNGYTGGVDNANAPTSGNYGWMQGTSMAAPQVTGAAAVVASKLGLRGAALRSRLLSTADDKGAAGYDTKFGNGRLNVYRAVTGTSAPAGQ